ncbi:MAG: hypothetical protein ABSH15_01230 [Verrucomicrobiota bacterium]
MALRGFTPSSDHFDKICQFLAGIEIYPFAGRIGKSQAPVTFALDPHQVIVNFGVLGGILIARVRLSAGCHGNGSLSARQYGVNSTSKLAGAEGNFLMYPSRRVIASLSCFVSMGVNRAVKYNNLPAARL